MNHQGDSFAGYMGNLTGKTEKSGTVEASDKAGNVDTICILLGDVDPTAEKLYRSDQNTGHHGYYEIKDTPMRLPI